ncbi:MAG: 16S rRNA (uracil(1498)-N(3))-methyltransferase [Polyangiaceae bacterium]|nr:16S rRNA (uracil(1498)-N(3))-methyltransferase [Polyangiaceae bacterium]
MVESPSSKKKNYPGETFSPLRHSTSLAVGATFELFAFQLDQLALREVNVKEAFSIVDTNGIAHRASLLSNDGKTARAKVYETLPSSPESPLDLTLYCCVLSRQRMITVVQKATELGVHTLVPVLSDYSVAPADLEKEKPWAWQGQAIRATKQCRRTRVPVVTSVTTLGEVFHSERWRTHDVRFLLDDRMDNMFVPTKDTARKPLNAGLFVGPEGGFSDRERALLVDASAENIRLGSRVLRAETAVYAGLTLLQHWLGDM